MPIDDSPPPDADEKATKFQKRVTLNVRVPEHIRARLRAIAKAETRSMTATIINWVTMHPMETK